MLEDQLPGVALHEVNDESVAFAVNSGLLEGKAVESEELESGDLIVSGWAARYEGTDRESENFADGAFQRGIKSFLEGQASLCYHHRHDTLLGRVLELEEVEGKGLRFKARVDHQPESSPLRHLYNAIKKGTLRGVSAGGFFKRKLTETGRKIVDVDLTELSLTPVPVHAGTSFEVIAGKALEDNAVIKEEEATDALIAAVDALRGGIEALEAKALVNKNDPQPEGTA